MKLTNGTTWGAIALTCTLSAGVAAAATPRSGACADMNNNGVCDAGIDVNIDKEIANDGYFSTARSEGAYTPPATGKVGIVLPGKVAGRRGVVYLVASGDIYVNSGAGSGGSDDATVMISNQGSVRIKDNVKLKGGLFLKLQAALDIEAGRNVQFSAKNNDLGGQLYLVAQGGRVTLGDRTSINAGGYASVSTGETGGSIGIGKGSKLTSSKGSVSVTSNQMLDIRNATFGARTVLLGSHSSNGRGVNSPGLAKVTDCQIEASQGVRLYADGAEGSTLDISGTTFETENSSDVTLDADIIVR